MVMKNVAFKSNLALVIWNLAFYYSLIEVWQIAQLLAKADALVIFVSVSLVTQISAAERKKIKAFR